jgi:hypothetical protein
MFNHLSIERQISSEFIQAILKYDHDARVSLPERMVLCEVRRLGAMWRGEW